MTQKNSAFIRLVMFLIAATSVFAMPAQADLEQIKQAGVLKVAIYNEFAPFSAESKGIDVDLAEALTKKLGLKMSLLPFPAGDDVSEDLRNMVWKGHYLGYGPADLMMHVPVERPLMVQNEQVEIFAPYHRETIKMVHSNKKVPDFKNIDSLVGKKIGVDQTSFSALLLGGEPRFRDNLKLYKSPITALEDLKAGKLDAVMTTQSEIDSVLRGDADFPLTTVAFPKLPMNGWVIGLSVKKNETDLSRALQKAMDELVKSGELIKIFAKYGVSVSTP